MQVTWPRQGLTAPGSPGIAAFVHAEPKILSLA